ncbi:GDCCVxC domain-containing (seleno)protein [Blastococcus sp. PRF04-17]|uniref:GDCCVxC domain-containing (seleno)protein n=1 Tax=Blastococcus sp. PRF04-17 TaxID=2933797 RepID=UPI003F8D413B
MASALPTLGGVQSSTSVITCPLCGTETAESMPVDVCQYFYRCTGCAELLAPRSGDCCVFCSYGDSPCPPRQLTPFEPGR